MSTTERAPSCRTEMGEGSLGRGGGGACGCCEWGVVVVQEEEEVLKSPGLRAEFNSLLSFSRHALSLSTRTAFRPFASWPRLESSCLSCATFIFDGTREMAERIFRGRSSGFVVGGGDEKSRESDIGVGVVGRAKESEGERLGRRSEQRGCRLWWRGGWGVGRG